MVYPQKTDKRLTFRGRSTLKDVDSLFQDKSHNFHKHAQFYKELLYKKGSSEIDKKIKNFKYWMAYCSGVQKLFNN